MGLRIARDSTNKSGAVNIVKLVFYPTRSV